MLLALLAVALPTAALANSIDFSTNQAIDFTTGQFSRGIATRNVSGGFTQPNFQVRVVGSLGDIGVSTAALGVGCNGNGGGMCTFNTGMVTVRNPTTGAVIFTDSLDTGMIIKTSNGATITAHMLPNALDPSGGVVSFTISFAPGPNPSDNLIGGTGFASSAQGVIPEPSALLLLGTGVVGLGGLMRRKLRLAM